MFSLLDTYGSREEAIKNALKLEKIYGDRKDFANQNPCTTVHRLVIELFDLEKLLTE